MEAKKDTEKDLIADRVVHFGKLNIGASHVEKT